jgi:hypothetical protein
MAHTQAYYDEIRAKIAAHKQRCIADHNAEKEAYRKLFYEAMAYR